MEKVLEIEDGKFLIRPYRTEDEKGVLSLWQLAFYKDLPENIWRWKFINSPYRHRIMLCRDRQGNILAMFSGIPYSINREGKITEMTHLMDNMSHPDYRKTGLFIRTINHFISSFTGPDRSVFLYGFPGKYHFSIGEKYQQYRMLTGGISFLTAKTDEIAKSSNLGEIVRISAADDSFDRIWEKCSVEYPFSVIRDAKFLRWRFFEHPFNRYHVWQYKNSSKQTVAYAVCLLKDEKAILADILIPDSSEIIGDFIACIASELSGMGVKNIETWLPAPHFTSKALIESGFTSLPEPLGIVPTGRTFDKSLSFEWASENIFYTMADGDLF